MRVALVHEWLDTWAGSEQVLAELGRIFPQADLFTIADFAAPRDRARLGPRAIRTSVLQHAPFARRWFRYAAVLWPQVMERFDLSAYDLVVSSSHALAKGVRLAPAQVHVCYCHAPARFAWSMEDTYLAQGARGSAWKAALMRQAVARFRAWDHAAAQRVTAFAANSRHIAKAIAHYYGREATVVYPPVDVERFAAARGAHNGGYVTVSRLVPYKRVDLIVEAFRQLPARQLTIVGDGPERARLQAQAPPNVRFTGALDDAGTAAAMAAATAFVFAALEDFGIAPVEAQAAGIPVIAYGAGGTAETVRDLAQPDPTGVLFDAQSASALVAAIERYEAGAGAITPAACRRNAARFTAARFRAEMADLIDRVLADAGAGTLATAGAR